MIFLLFLLFYFIFLLVLLGWKEGMGDGIENENGSTCCPMIPELKAVNGSTTSRSPSGLKILQ